MIASPNAVLCELSTTEGMPALCFNVATPDASGQRNGPYAQELAILAKSLGVPGDCLRRILNDDQGHG